MATGMATGMDWPVLEFWFEFGSTYSYLSVMRIEALAERAQVRVLWRPFLLGPLFAAQGLTTSPFVAQPEKGRYMWTDLARQARKYGLPFRQPLVFPRNAVRPMRVAVLGADQPWIGAFCRAVMRQNFVDDLDISEPANVREALAQAVAYPDDWIARADSVDNKPLLRAQTEAARQRGIFGAPTFFVEDEMFWGDDRLDAAMTRAAELRAPRGNLG